MEIDQNKLHTKFLALSVDVNSPSLDPLGSKRPAHASVKEGYPSKKWSFSAIGCLAWKWLQIGTDMLLINVNIDDLEW